METQTHEESTSAAETPEVKTSGGATSDVSEYRTFAILGYILPFLFFLPLLDEKTKNVPYVRFHANQQLILLILSVGIYLLSGPLFMVFFALGIFLMQLINVAVLVLAVLGAVRAYNGEMKELPLIGHFRLLK
ncbi:MAG: hypothetical protein RLZZ230_660 [Candidatus Parcubacteria bacterium]|jgi:uncharacterized membrane protein